MIPISEIFLIGFELCLNSKIVHFRQSTLTFFSEMISEKSNYTVKYGINMADEDIEKGAGAKLSYELTENNNVLFEN